MPDDRLAAVAKSIGISRTPDSTEALRRDIRTELGDLHPDRNGGDFVSTDNRDRYNELSAALAELDGDTGTTALVPVSTVAPMVAAILEALNSTGQLDAQKTSSAARTQAIRTEAREEAAYRFRLSRYTSGVVGMIASAIWIFPTMVSAFGSQDASTVLEASILAPMFAHVLFEPISFGIGLYAWMFFALTWFMEQNDRSRIDWVTTDSARGALMRRAISFARLRGEQDSITKADLRNAVGSRFRPIFALRALGVRDVTASFLDRVVAHHINELTAQGVLTPSDSASLSPRYTIAESVNSELNVGAGQSSE